MKKLFAYTICMIMMSSCFRENSEIHIIDIDSPAESIELKLSDLLKDIKVIPLETKDDVLLAAQGVFKVSSKYIVYYSSSEMHLFDKDGKHLKLLTISGGGPNEFSQVSNAFINDENDMLYYTDPRNRRVLYRIDLISGRYLDPIETQGEDLRMSYMDNTGNIYGFFPVEQLKILSGNDKRDTSSCYIAHKYNINKGTIEGIEVPGSYISSGLNRFVFEHNDDIYIYDSSYSDTLFNYRQNKLSPAMIVKMKDIMADMQVGGNVLNTELAYEGGFLFNHSYAKIDIKTGLSGNIESITVMRPTKNYLIADRKSGSLSVIKSFYIDPIGATINITKAIDREQRDSQPLGINEFIKKSGDYGFCLIDAYKMESLIEEALSGDKLSIPEKEALRKLGTTINEDSNPVIITGKIR